MSAALVRVSVEPPLAVLELERKQRRNALSMALRDELEARLAALDADDAVRAVVLTGGPECFSAGFDLAEVLATDLRAFSHRTVEFTEATHFFAKPLVTAVAGPALAGGFDLALCGDVIVAADSASFGRPEVRFGINPLLAKLAARVGMARALRMSLSGDMFTASQALALGLVDRVVPAAELAGAAREEAARIARHPLPVLRALKRAARAVPCLDARSAIEYESGLAASLLAEGSAKAALRDYVHRLGVADGPPGS